MGETIKAKLHRVVGGQLCDLRGRHNLVLGDSFWHEPEPNGLMRLTSARRPFCRTCWTHPGD